MRSVYRNWLVGAFVLNYREWAERVLAFTKRLESFPGKVTVSVELRPPMSASKLRALNGRLRIPLPEPLCAFRTLASSHCKCDYQWELPEELHGLALELDRHETRICGGVSFRDSRWLEGAERGCND